MSCKYRIYKESPISLETAMLLGCPFVNYDAVTDAFGMAFKYIPTLEGLRLWTRAYYTESDSSLEWRQLSPVTAQYEEYCFRFGTLYRIAFEDEV